MKRLVPVIYLAKFIPCLYRGFFKVLGIFVQFNQIVTNYRVRWDLFNLEAIGPSVVISAVPEEEFVDYLFF